MRLLITEVTDMSAGNFCVAGWDAQQGTMIRPLPNGGNWTTALLARYDLQPGIEMDFVPAGRRHNGTFPHSTEDTVVDMHQISVAGRPVVDWFGPNSPARAATVQEAFEGNVKNSSEFRGRLQSIIVPPGTNCRSLWGIEISQRNIELITEFDKLKAVIDDGEEQYVLSVSGHALKEVYQAGGVNAATATLPDVDRLHVRLGLARAFPAKPNECFLMVNGIYG